MDASPLQYDLWVEEALRNVVRRALTHVAKNGLPGDHHFYLTVKTAAPGVDLPETLRSQYPDEMTIVLQNQFWNLAVFDDGFEVTLSFGGVRSKLRIPYGALTAFADPATNFGLQMKPIAPAADDASATGTAGGVSVPGPVKPSRPSRQDRKQAAAESQPEGGQVIALDAFRKK